MTSLFKLPGAWRHTQRWGASITRLGSHASTHWPGTRCRVAIGGPQSFELSGGSAAGSTFINTMELRARAVSSGGFEALATQPAALWSGAIGDDAAAALSHRGWSDSRSGLSIRLMYARILTGLCPLSDTCLSSADRSRVNGTQLVVPGVGSETRACYGFRP